MTLALTLALTLTALSCVAVLRGVVAREGALEDVRPVHTAGHEALAPG
jgi:hypothetical protein